MPLLNRLAKVIFKARYLSSVFETWLQMSCKSAVISGYSFQATAPCPLKPGSSPQRQGVPGNCLSFSLIHPPLNRRYLNSLGQNGFKNRSQQPVEILKGSFSASKCSHLLWAVLRNMLQWEPMHYGECREFFTWPSDSLFPRTGKALADLHPALASWVCKPYNGLFLAVSSAKSMVLSWTSPVPPPAATCTKLLFCSSASPLHRPSRNQAGTVSSEERNIPQLCPARGRSMVFKYKSRFITWEKCRVHFVSMFLILSDLEGKYFITAAVAKSTAVPQPSPWRGQHVTWLWTQRLRGMIAFLNHISPVVM